jgi:Sulfocyanin (SoxE) domain
VNTAKTGNEIASCCQTSSRSHHRTIAGGGGLALIAVIVLAAGALAGCDPLQGSGTGVPPDPSKYIQVDDKTRTAIVTLLAGYPATDFQFNYNGYGNGALVLTAPVGWQITIQCENRGTVPFSCAVVSGGGDTSPLDPAWSTPNPKAGLQPGESASFAFTPMQPGTYRIASLVAGTEASGAWADLRVVSTGRPALTAPQP